MDPYLAWLTLLIGLGVGAAAAWLARGRAVTAEAGRAARTEAALHDERLAHAKAAAAAERATGLESELRHLREQLSAAAEANARLEEARIGAERAHAEKVAALTSLRGEIEKDMHAIATAALQGSQSSFLLLAGQAFESHKKDAANLFAQKEQAIANLLNPVAAALDAYQKGLSGFERAHAVLASEVQNVQTQARKLVTALQASPKTRGRWGEQQLQNVIELAGMTAHVDYFLQQTVEGEEGRLRPDLVIRLPGERRLVVDAKAPLTAFFDAHEAVEEGARDEHLRRHAQQVRHHMKQLGSKRYWEALLPTTPDFVVMFIPGENFYCAAIERDPDLLQDGLKERVLIVSPTMLVGLAKTVALSWRQESAAENARRVAELGRDLYRRLAQMGRYITDLGKGLESAVRHYNSFVGSLESRVLPQGRRFNELQVEGTADPLPELKLVELETRQLRPDSELLSAPADVIHLAAGERVQPAEKANS